MVPGQWGNERVGRRVFWGAPLGLGWLLWRCCPWCLARPLSSANRPVVHLGSHWPFGIWNILHPWLNGSPMSLCILSLLNTFEGSPGPPLPHSTTLMAHPEWYLCGAGGSYPCKGLSSQEAMGCQLPNTRQASLVKKKRSPIWIPNCLCWPLGHFGPVGTQPSDLHFCTSSTKCRWQE